jgi:hypothetical protein
VVIMKPSNCIPNATGLPPHVKSRSWLCWERLFTLAAWL